MKNPAILAILLTLFTVYFQLNDKEAIQIEPNLRCPAGEGSHRLVLGHIETVKMGDDQNIAFEAKIDSGAEVTSLHAEKIHPFTKTIFEENTQKEVLYVQFTTIDDHQKKHHLTRMVSRVDQVKSASGISTRYFFKESLWVKNKEYEIEVNLADRSLLSRKLLIGRNILNQGYLIDTSRSYLLTKSLKTIDD